MILHTALLCLMCACLTQAKAIAQKQIDPIVQVRTNLDKKAEPNFNERDIKLQVKLNSHERPQTNLDEEVKRNPLEKILLSSDEERCIAQTGVSEEVVIMDKTPGSPDSLAPSDPLLNDYLYCYLQALREVVVNRKDVYHSVPGYKTLYMVNSLWCDENGNHPSGSFLQCALRPTFKNGLPKA